MSSDNEEESIVQHSGPSPSQPTMTQAVRNMTSPNSVELKWMSRYRKLLLFKAGITVIQSPHTTTERLHNRMMSVYQSLVLEHNPFADEKLQDVMGVAPRESVWDEIKEQLMLTTQKGNLTGKSLYNQFKVMKSELSSQWIPPFGHVQSGENLEDKFKTVHAHVWAYRRNEQIKKNNRSNAADPSKQRPLVSPEDCPEDHHILSMYSEMPLFKLYHDHPLLNVSFCYLFFFYGNVKLTFLFLFLSLLLAAGT